MSIFSAKDLDGGQASLFMTRRPVTLIPPIRLNIEDVEKALQADCKRDMKRLQQQQQQQQPQSSKFIKDLWKSSKHSSHWLPLFDLFQQEIDVAKENSRTTHERSGDQDDQPTRIPLKRLKPISLFETSKRKLRKTANGNMDVVLDTQSYQSLFQQTQKWRQGDSVPFIQEKDNTTVENQLQLQQQQIEQQQPLEQEQQQQQPLEQEQQDTIDILEEVLGETDYNSRSRIIVPSTKKRNSLSKSTSTSTVTRALPTPSTPTPSSPPRLLHGPSTSTVTKPIPTIETTEISETAATQSVSAPPPPPTSPPESSTTTTAAETDSQLGATNIAYEIPRQNVPVFGTALQYRSVQQEINRLTNFSASAFKHRVGKVIDIFNHPLIAILPDYTDSDGGHWQGSGKTLLLQQLISRLEERTQLFNLAIVCYDLNSEEFLVHLIKHRYPVERLNVVKKDGWSQEHGVIVRIKKDQPISTPKSDFTTKVDLAIIMDIRVQPNDSVMDMFENTTSSGPPPIVSLVTDRSVELRMQDYISKLSPPKWRLPDQAACASIFDTKNDTPVENSGLLTYMVVDSVIRWIDSGMKKDYQFANTNQRAVSPQADTDDHRQLSTLPTSSSPRSSTTKEHQEQQYETTPTDLHTDQLSLPARSTSPANLIDNDMPKETTDPTTTITPSLQDDLAKLFTHVSLERLQHDLNLYKSDQEKSSNHHYGTRSDDEDSFYSAKSESLSDDNTSSKVQAVIDSLQGTFGDIGETTQSSDMLKSMKMEFDKKCLGLFQAMVSSYQKSVVELRNEYATEAERKLALPSTSTDASI